MKVEFLKKFSKDIDDIKVKSVKQALLRLVESMEALDSLEKIPNTKKLKGELSGVKRQTLPTLLLFNCSTPQLSASCHRTPTTS